MYFETDNSFAIRNSNMKFSRLLLAAVLTLSVSFAPLAQETPAPAPAIEFESSTHEFSKVKSGEVILHTFKFKNTGGADLTIEDVKPSCGCTTAGEWSKLLKPGESGTIPIKLDTSRFKGALTKTVTVTSNDPKKPRIVLMLKGEIWEPVTIEPAYLTFKSVTDPKEVYTQSAKITNNTEAPLKIKSVKINNDNFSTDLKEIKPGKEYELTVQTVPPLKSGYNYANVEIETDNPESPALTIRAFANVVPIVQASPSQLIFPASVAGKPVKRYVTVFNHQEEPIEVSDVRLDAEGVEYTLTTVKPGKVFRIEIEVGPDFKLNGQSALLKFKTSHPEFSEIAVPVRQYQTRSTVTSARKAKSS